MADLAEGGVRWSWDTIPHLLTLSLGAILMFRCSILLGLIYIIIAALGMVWFLAFICTRCNAYGHKSCPSGYGLISKRFFKKRKGDFRRAFKLNIISVALQWFIPTGCGIFFLIKKFDPVLLILLIVFIMVAYVYLPLAARKKGCDTCPQRKDCPWKG